VVAWQEGSAGDSFLSSALAPVFERISTVLLSVDIAPNALTLMGTFAVVQAWWLCGAADGRNELWVVLIAATAYWVLGNLDSRHARHTMNDTCLTVLFKQACDLMGCVFLVSLACTTLHRGLSLNDQWHFVQSAQLVLLLLHLVAFERRSALRYVPLSPSDLALVVAGFAARQIALTDGRRGGASAELSEDLARGVHVDVLIAVLLVALVAHCRAKSLGASGRTSAALVLIAVLRGAGLWLRVMSPASASQSEVILDGLFLAVVSMDLAVAKMASRELHPSVVVMAAMVVVPKMQWIGLGLASIYFTGVFWDLMHHTNLPLLQVCRNAYCDGIYDLCHVGHKNAFKRAAKLGHRLFVGVVGDEDANNYKNPPVMSAAEREAEVAACRCVSKVIPNAPCFGLTEEFIRKHNIHAVAFGQEYLDRFPNPDDDPYYKAPRKMGIAVPTPRTQGISTSELCKRILTRGEVERKSPT